MALRAQFASVPFDENAVMQPGTRAELCLQESWQRRQQMIYLSEHTAKAATLKQAPGLGNVQKSAPAKQHTKRVFGEDLTNRVNPDKVSVLTTRVSASCPYDVDLV
jgi:hypothetical protein